MGFIFPILMLFSFSYGNSISEIVNSKVYFSIYFVFFIIPAILQFLSYSGNYKGAWIYKALPIDYPESIYRGAVKSVFINLFTPVFILVSIIFLIIFKFKIIGDIFIVYLNMMLSICILFMIQVKDLPFSKAFEVSQGRGGFISLILTLLCILSLVAAHYFIGKLNYGKYIYMGIVIIANIIAWKYSFRLKTS